MKKNTFLILILLFFVGVCSVKADLVDYNGGSSGSLGGIGSGSWCDKCVGLKISIVNSEGVTKDTEIFLNNTGLVAPTYFSTDMKPKFNQTDTAISWTSNVTRYTSSLIPDDWNDPDIINFSSLLRDNDYDNLKKFLNAKDPDGNKLFTDLSSGDYIIIEPMTKISNYYGTAFELYNDFDDRLDDSNRTWPWGGFAGTYNKSVFSGNSVNPDGGIFWRTIYLDKAILGMSVYTDTKDFKYDNRLDCFKDRTCGRGIGVYKYDDVYKPPKDEYTLDINVCVDGKGPIFSFPSNTYVKFDFKIAGEYVKRKDGTEWIGLSYDYDQVNTPGVAYELSNIEGIGIYEYKGYYVGARGTCSGTLVKENGIKKTFNTQTRSINLVLESNCQTRLSALGSNPSIQELFDLYQYEKEKGNDYRGLLNIKNPSCTSLEPPEKEIKNLTCLSGSTLSNANFTEKNLSQYSAGEIITDSKGSIKGFCLNSFYLKNNLGVQKFYAKAGQFLVREIEEKYGDNSYTELQIYNSSYNPVRSCGNKVATATVTKTCYTFLDSLDYENLEWKIDDVKLYFGDNDLDRNADELPVINDSSVVTSSEPKDGSTLKRYEFKREFVYGLNDVYLENITGKSTNSSQKVIKGITSKFNSTSGIIPFYINYYSVFQAGKDGNGNYKDLCTYETKPEIIIPPNKLNLEFRIIDTNKPFLRTPKSNWNDGSNEMTSNNTLINTYILRATNSYGMKDGNKQSPLYRIELTSTDILNIREYNKNTPYDNYKEQCEEKDGNTVCTNTFLNNLANGQVIIYDKEGKIAKTLTNKNKIELANNNSNNTDVSTNEITEINVFDINTPICSKVSSNNTGAIVIKNTNYKIGDKYECSVAPGVNYDFYIVGGCGENKINMIMEENLAKSGINWVSKIDFDANKSASWNKTYAANGNKVGPITVLKKLDELTSAWTNIIPYNYTLIDEINDFKYDYINNYINDQHHETIDPDIQSYNPIEKNSVRARLLSRNEANNCGCAAGLNECPSFLINGLSGYYSEGYWLSNSACISSTVCPSAYDMKNDDGAQSHVRWIKHTDSEFYYNGIRPVITVYLSQISN